LLDLGVLIVDVQGRDDPVGDDSGAEPAGGFATAFADDAPIEDQADLVRAADVEVVMQHLLEEDPPRDGPVEHLGQGELRLQDRQLIAVAGGLVLGRERVGQDRQPFAQQRVDVFRAEAVADRLDSGHVLAGGEPVVQRLEPDAGLRGLAFGPLVAVDAQLGGVGEVGAELEEERAEVGVHAVEVEEVDERRRADQPGVATPGRLAVAALGAPHPGLLLGPADEQHPLLVGELRQELLREVVLALALGERHQLQPARGDEAVDVGDERLGHRIHQRRRGVVVAAVADEEALHPAAVGQSGLPHVEIHPVDALQLEDHMLVEDISDAARYRHDWLRSTGGQHGPPTALSGSYTGPARRSRSQSRRPEPPTPTRPAEARLRAWGAARLEFQRRRSSVSSSSICSLRTSPPTVSCSVTVCLPSRTRSTGTASVSTTGRWACSVTSCSSSEIAGPSWAAPRLASVTGSRSRVTSSRVTGTVTCW